MPVLIINASPRNPAVSNTSMLLSAFRQGLSDAGVGMECYDLARREQWQPAKNAFHRHQCILFALPVFNGTLPAIVLEFWEALAQTEAASQAPQSRSISFLLHCGCPEANQLRCCERLLRSIPAQLGGTYAGILSRGDTICTVFLENQKAAILSDYTRMGKLFAQHNCSFLFPEAEAFSGQEYMEAEEAVRYCKFTNRFFRHFAQMQGTTEDLSSRPLTQD